MKYPCKVSSKIMHNNQSTYHCHLKKFDRCSVPFLEILHLPKGLYVHVYIEVGVAGGAAASAYLIIVMAECDPRQCDDAHKLSETYDINKCFLSFLSIFCI